jgi:DNA polymerase II large subunit
LFSQHRAPATKQVDSNISVSSSEFKYSKNANSSNIWIQYCDNNKHNTTQHNTTTHHITFQNHWKIKLRKKASSEDKVFPGMKSLILFSEEMNALKKKTKLKNTASVKKRKEEIQISPPY